ncbi:MAG: hypothetical protein LH465_04160 [Sphingomonas bacterium]|nr:hypothetical protein [Sphingomonas bacterium]
MASNQAVDRNARSAADAQRARVVDHGSADHRHVAALASATGPEAARDLADAVHLLCSLYGRHPGLVELALHHAPAGPVRDWLRDASDGFERERLYLVRLTSAVGPLPSTPGSAETESILSSQRHAIETLAVSERRGCALGATTALVGDWAAVRKVLDRAALRMGVEVPPSNLPDGAAVSRVIEVAVDGPAAERALGFGAEQLLLQNRGLFDLLEARASARSDC